MFVTNKQSFTNKLPPITTNCKIQIKKSKKVKNKKLYNYVSIRNYL